MKAIFNVFCEIIKGQRELLNQFQSLNMTNKDIYDGQNVLWTDAFEFIS
jgi:hypothetical protein